MTNTAVLDQPATEELSLPNKFIYPEFAGFAGEDLLHEIVTIILPVALLRTWEIFERKHAYDNDCYQSLGTVTKKASRTQRTINRHIATFMARRLLVMRPGYKFQRRPDGSMFKKGVTIKDFSGLYALAHEYYLWQRDEERYLTAEFENLEHIQSDPRLVAKLCRFEDYRRLLERHRDPFAQVQEDRRFTEYLEAPPLDDGEGRADGAEENSSGQNKTKLSPKEVPIEASKVSHKRINEKAYGNSLERDSFDSDEGLEIGEGADAHRTSVTEPGARDYTKQVRGYETGTKPNESQTNPVPPPPHKNVPPGAGNTGENKENHPDVRSAQDAMAKAGVTPGRSARHQAEELPPPPKHPLARSFVHEVAGLFGDLNEKGSKTGIERKIESFALESAADVLLCLVRAYTVARDTKAEKIRYRRPDGSANRMPLFCTMFGRFAQALGPGSKWQYTWEQMVEDIAADDRLSLWVSEHQAELAGEAGDQVEASQLAAALAFVEELTEEEASEAGEEPEEPEEEHIGEDEEFELVEDEEEDELTGEDGEPEEVESEEPEESFAEEDEGESSEEAFTEEGEEPGESLTEDKEVLVLAPTGGWKTREMAYDWAAYVMNELLTNSYGDLEVSVSLPQHIDRYQVIVQNAEGVYYCLVCREDVRTIVAMARNRTLFADPETSDNQAATGD